MLSTIIGVSAAILISILEIFVITRWIKRREISQAQQSWTPFRIVFLDALLKYSVNVLHVSKEFSKKMELLSNEIKSAERLREEDFDSIKTLVSSFRDYLNYRRSEFYFIVQTVSPSLQPYAAELCNEVIWFDWAISKTLDGVEDNILVLEAIDRSDKNAVERPLTKLFSGPSLMSIHFIRFSAFPKNLVKQAEERERLFFSERHGGFASQYDHERSKRSEALDEEFREFEKQNPRTLPIKTFWDTEESWKQKVSKMGPENK